MMPTLTNTWPTADVCTAVSITAPDRQQEAA
jgi:hypothetical protein